MFRITAASTACALLVTACHLDVDDPPGAPLGSGTFHLKDPQGQSLLGDDIDLLPAAASSYASAVTGSVDPQKLDSLYVEDGELVGYRGSVRHDGTSGALLVELLTTGGHRLRIVAIHPPVPPATTTGLDLPPGMEGVPLHSYEVEVEAAGHWQPLCHRAESPAWNRAWVTQGRWQRGAGGQYLPLPGELTFACPGDGVAAKCLGWGYAPWDATPDHYQACVRMGRADYCGADESNTLDGTEVDMFDMFGRRGTSISAATWPGVSWSAMTPINAPDASNRPVEVLSGYQLPPLPMPDGAMYLEAAWSGDGAVCIGRLRWHIFPAPRTSGHCAGLPDPPAIPVCDDMAPKTLHNGMGALLYNSSYMNERGLYVWTNGTHRLTSGRGLCLPGGGIAQAPEPGYDTAVYEGIVFTRDGDGRVALKSWRHAATGQFVVSTDPPGGGPWVSEKVEGFIVAPEEQPDARPDEILDIEAQTDQFRGAQLFLYIRSLPPLPPRYHTGTSRPPGWSGAHEALLGWIVQPSDMSTPFGCGP